MAHIFSLFPETPDPYIDGKLTSDKPTKFPSTPAFASMNKPSRFEGSILNLEYSGTIPPSLSGTFYRIQPDTRFPPLYASDIHFNGDGAVSAIRIHAGQADFLHRYVRTERYNAETLARRALFGRYRNPHTDNESVKGVIRTASNTNVVFYRGMLLAMKEDGPPFAMDPDTLETIGRYDFEGQIDAPTFTAHPKFDPATGEMVCFAYEAGGDGSDCSVDVVVWTIDGDGKKTEEAWYKAPFAGMIHDVGVSENWVVLPLTPLKMDRGRMKKGGNKFAWDPEEDQWYGVVPRRGGRAEDIVWFRADNGFHGHVAGCYELPTGEVVFDLTVADGNVFFFFPPDPSVTPGFDSVAKRNQLSSPTVRWIFDPKAKKSAVEYPEGTVYVADERVKPALTWATNGEFSRIDDRYVTKPYRHFWQAVVDPTKPYDFAKCGPPAGGLFNTLGHYTWSDEHVHDGSSASGSKAEVGKYGLEDTYFPGPTMTFQEPTFIPKEGGAEGEGYIIALLNHLDELRNDVVILDALHLSKGPLAVIHLPLKVKLGLHGNWVDNRDIEAWKARRAEGGDVGPVKVATEPLPWQKAFFAKRDAEKTKTTNGTDH
ncbi:carotenoid oxygenase [Podospora aff. communis PSN243]|uniref:Carotenoid oxygenase n=1 Tax=Podospora aff. communis PSN243 TaxID=3040156 RepID=A0AAV9GK37_9PEZI|nr:carotenoid oxygenase [Podospora aff. communis PSN243]